MRRSSGWTLTWGIVRVLTAMAGTLAIIAQLQRTVSNAVTSPGPDGAQVGTVVVNFLSFFTIQSNAAAVVTLTIGAILLSRSGRHTTKTTTRVDPRWFAVLLTCTTTYMLITGIVYNLLLRGIVLPQGQTVPWANEVLHVVVPIMLALDLFFGPRRRGLAWRSVWVVIVYPALWVIYTLVRGPFVTAPESGAGYWYPYPFLDPNNPALQPPGYAGVAVYVAAIALAIVVIGLLVVWIGLRRGSGSPSEAARAAQ